jgi:hypothetical protein
LPACASRCILHRAGAAWQRLQFELPISEFSPSE